MDVTITYGQSCQRNDYYSIYIFCISASGNKKVFYKVHLKGGIMMMVFSTISKNMEHH